MGTWISLYTDLRATLVRERGRGARGRTGADLPTTYAHEPFIHIAMLWDDFLDAIKRAAGLDYAVYVQTLEIEGFTSVPYGNKLPIVDWLTYGKSHPSDSSIRFYSPLGGSSFAVPWTLGILPPGDGNDESVWLMGQPGDRNEVRALMSKWNEAIKSAGLMLAKMATHPRMTEDQTVEWWSTLYQLMIAIEVSSEFPRPTTRDRFLGGLREAGKASVKAVQDVAQVTADVAGRAAAELAKTAGIAAGSAAKGFFDQAGMTAYVAVAIAIVISLH